MNSVDFQQSFKKLTGDLPFPWQEGLFGEFAEGRFPRALDIPTGLGKTSVMTIWLIALTKGAPVPRKLVYIVDRRAVVDQATETAKDLRVAVEADANFRNQLGLDRPLPISTLRGQQVDNR